MQVRVFGLIRHRGVLKLVLQLKQYQDLRKLTEKEIHLKRVIHQVYQNARRGIELSFLGSNEIPLTLFFETLHLPRQAEVWQREVLA